MNTPSEDNNLSGIIKEFEVTFRRPMRRFQWFVWVMVAIIIGMSAFLPLIPLPRPIKVTMILGSAFVALLGAFGFLWWLAPRHPMVRQMRPAPRRLAGRVVSAMLLYFAVFEAVTFFYQRLHLTGLTAVLAALAPSVPILFAIRAMMLFLKEEGDEFLRSRMLESWAIATGLALAVCTVWGFLDQFEVVPHLPLWAAFPLWAGCLGPAQFFLHRRDT